MKTGVYATMILFFLLVTIPITGAANTINITSPDSFGAVGVHSGTPFTGNGGALMHYPTLEEQTNLHFTTAGTGSTILSATLNIPVYAFSDPDPTVLEVYTFFGDGVVSIDELNVGSYFHTFSGFAKTSYLTLSVDVTDLLQDAVDINAPYLSFNLRTTNQERILLGAAIGCDNPTITYTSTSVPEPAMLLLIGFGLLSLAGVKNRLKD